MWRRSRSSSSFDPEPVADDAPQPARAGRTASSGSMTTCVGHPATLQTATARSRSLGLATLSRLARRRSGSTSCRRRLAWETSSRCSHLRIRSRPVAGPSMPRGPGDPPAVSDDRRDVAAHDCPTRISSPRLIGSMRRSRSRGVIDQALSASMEGQAPRCDALAPGARARRGASTTRRRRRHESVRMLRHRTVSDVPRRPATSVCGMSEQGWREFLSADDVDDWVILHGGPTAVFKVGSLQEAARLAAAVADVPGLEPRTLLTAASDRLTVKLTREMWGTEARHVDVARAISAVAREHGATADRSAGPGGPAGGRRQARGDRPRLLAHGARLRADAR